MARHYDVAQGSDRWSILRMGRASSSDFDQIITPTGLVAKGDKVDKYENRLIAEIMLMRPVRTMAPSYAMERGKALEPEARDAYEFATGKKLIHAGFITDDLGHYGCSPDALVKDENIGVEIKCPLSEEKHIGYLLDPKSFIDEHKPQVQGQIFVAGFDAVDMISYFPELPRVIVRAEPIEIFQTNLKIALDGLWSRMNEKIERLVDAGHLSIEGYEKAVQEASLIPDLTEAG